MRFMRVNSSAHADKTPLALADAHAIAQTTDLATDLVLMNGKMIAKAGIDQPTVLAGAMKTLTITATKTATTPCFF
jgi:hypothetical protein